MTIENPYTGPPVGISNSAQVDLDTELVTIGVTTPVEPPTPSPSVLEFVDSLSTPVAAYAENEDVYVQLTDDDPNLDVNVAETVTVNLLNPTTGDRETLILTETGINTGVFATMIPSSTSTGLGIDDGAINASAGDVLEASYTDPIFPTDTSNDSAPIVVPSETKTLYPSVA